jgi:RNA polymerase sigma-70 factor, ECF subfamily
MAPLLCDMAMARPEDPELGRLPGNLERAVRPVVSVAVGRVPSHAEAASIMAEAPILLAVLRTVLARDADADDVFSATVEIAMRQYAQLRDPTRLRSWLLAIAIREAYRFRRRVQNLVRLDGLGEPEHIGHTSADDALSARQALHTLPRRMRLAVTLHYMVGLSVVEVAETLGTSPNTVKTQLRLGLARLRKELADGDQ